MTDTPPLEPLFKNVLCKREEEEKYTGAIYIPETAKEKPMGARVVAIGADVERVKVGDFVLCGRYSGADVHVHSRGRVVHGRPDGRLCSLRRRGIMPNYEFACNTCGDRKSIIAAISEYDEATLKEKDCMAWAGDAACPGVYEQTFEAASSFLFKGGAPTPKFHRGGWKGENK